MVLWWGMVCHAPSSWRFVSFCRGGSLFFASGGATLGEVAGLLFFIAIRSDSSFACGVRAPLSKISTEPTPNDA
jgi:hypothetical protein